MDDQHSQLEQRAAQRAALDALKRTIAALERRLTVQTPDKLADRRTLLGGLATAAFGAAALTIPSTRAKADNNAAYILGAVNTLHTSSSLLVSEFSSK